MYHDVTHTQLHYGVDHYKPVIVWSLIVKTTTNEKQEFCVLIDCY